MRRFISITALVAAMFVSLSLEAQRGGMGGRGFGGGGHVSPGFRSRAPGGGRGFAGGGRGFAGGGRGFAPSGPRGFAPGGARVFAPSRPFSPRTFSSSGFGVGTFAPSHRR